MSGALAVSAWAASLSRRARRYFMTGQPLALAKACARCARETPQEAAMSGSDSTWVELRAMTHRAWLTMDMGIPWFRAVPGNRRRGWGGALDRLSGATLGGRKMLSEHDRILDELSFER